MIKNDKQYNITKKRLKEFKKHLTDLFSDKEVDPFYKKIQEDAIKSQILRFEDEIKEYEELKHGDTSVVYIDSLAEIPEVLIKARISRGWTHSELATKLNLKEQQIQRYELCNYSTASVARVNEIASALEIKINKPMKVQLSTPNFILPEGFDIQRLEDAQKRLSEQKSILTF